MPKRVVTLAETRAAQAFLRSIGAATNDPNVIAAVVAWYNTAQDNSKYTDNPFELKPGAWDVGLTSGVYREVVGYRWVEDDDGVLHKEPLYSNWSKYASMNNALLAMANFLKANPGKYGSIIRELRLGNVQNALRLIANADLTNGDYGIADLMEEIGSYSGVILSPGTPGTPGTPAQPTNPTQPKPVPMPKPTREQAHKVTRPEYLQPYAARNFYLARRPKEPTLPEVKSRPNVLPT